MSAVWTERRRTDRTGRPLPQQRYSMSPILTRMLREMRLVFAIAVLRQRTVARTDIEARRSEQWM